METANVKFEMRDQFFFTNLQGIGTLVMTATTWIASSSGEVTGDEENSSFPWNESLQPSTNEAVIGSLRSCTIIRGGRCSRVVRFPSSC
jgi:hypothetical protein